MIIILLLSLYFFFKRKNLVYALSGYIFMVSEAFRLLPQSFLNFGIKWNDACLIYLFLTSFYLYSRKQNYFSIKNDEVAKAISYILLYFTILLFATWIFIDQDCFSAIKVYRLYLLYAIYFQFRLLGFKSKLKIFKFIFVLIAITAGLFIQQVATGIPILVGGADEVATHGELTRYRNTSLFVEIGLFAILFTTCIKRYSTLFTCILASALILPMSRTITFVFAGITAVYYFFFYRKKKRLLKYFIPLFIGLAAVWPYFAQRLAKENTLEDIQLTTSLKSSEDFEGGGNFVFRMAIFLERSEYLLKKNLFLFGVGLVHEDSKYTQKTFNFRYGANRTVNGERYKQQVATNDTSWTTIFIISGLIGILLHFYLIYAMIKRFIILKRYHEVFVVPLLSLILCVCTSITDYRLALFYYYTLFFLFASTSIKSIKNATLYNSITSHN